MRITGGFARGFNLKVPRIPDIRPAQEVVRLAAFSILADEVEGAEVLDMYAGSGSFGLDALSRGAKHAIFVDNNPLSIEAIEQNLQHARFGGKAEVVRADALRYLVDCLESFDIIFAAPPYAYGAAKGLLYNFAEHLKPHGVIVFDHAKTTTFNPTQLDGLEIVDQRSYGATGLTFMRHVATSLAEPMDADPQDDLEPILPDNGDSGADI